MVTISSSSFEKALQAVITTESGQWVWGNDDSSVMEQERAITKCMQIITEKMANNLPISALNQLRIAKDICSAARVPGEIKGRMEEFARFAGKMFSDLLNEHEVFNRSSSRACRGVAQGIIAPIDQGAKPSAHVSIRQNVAAVEAGEKNTKKEWRTLFLGIKRIEKEIGVFDSYDPMQGQWELLEQEIFFKYKAFEIAISQGLPSKQIDSAELEYEIAIEERKVFSAKLQLEVATIKATACKLELVRANLALRDATFAVQEWQNIAQQNRLVECPS